MNLLDRLRGGLIVSVQAWPGSAIDDPAVIAALAAAAEANGAVAVRVQGAANLRAVRARVNIPIVGLVKREYPGYAPYITPTMTEVNEVCGCGVQFVAFDATQRLRPDGSSDAEMVEAIRRGGALAFADCARPADAVAARAAGAPITATTMCSYTGETAGATLPAFDLVRAFKREEGFVVCEGGVTTPELAAQALANGADAVVVGSAITNTDWIVRQYVAKMSWPA